MSARVTLPARRRHRTQKVKLAGQRTVYVSVHDDAQPKELFVRVKGPECTAEVIALYDVLARLMSVALQYGAPLEQLAELLAGVQVAPAGPITGHDRLKHCSSIPDLIGRHLLIEYGGRDDLAHQPARPTVGTPSGMHDMHS